jgi:uncharacterized cupredoxin-like copper-binding protein
MRRVVLILAGAAALASAAVAGHGGDGDHADAHAASGNDRTAFGRPGSAAKATRTVEVTMTDAMRFSPASLTVAKGDTVRFRVRNEGKLEHEMVLGTSEHLREHAESMRGHPDMAHAEPNAVQVKPGEQGELVWTFDKPGRFAFGCLVPGHFEAGMKGTVVVK